MTAPVVSVVIPAYNCAKYLPDALNSALTQQGVAVEVIVVNDGSSDDTDSVVEPYRNRIVHIRQDNRGLSAARNVGFQACRGEFVCFLDADDILLPGKFERQLAKFREQPDLGVVVSGYIDVEEDGRTEILRVEKPWRRDGLQRLLRHESFPPHTALIRRDVLARSRLFPENIDTWESQEDWQLWLELALAGVPFDSVSGPTCLFRSRAGSIRSDPQRHYRGAQRVVRWLRGHQLARQHSSAIDELDAFVEMETVAIALRLGDLQDAAERMVRADERRPDYWERPSTFQDLFTKSLDLRTSALRKGPNAGAAYEERVKKFVDGVVAPRVPRQRWLLWSIASCGAEASIAEESGDRATAAKLRLRALRMACRSVTTSPAAAGAALLLVRGLLAGRGLRPSRAKVSARPDV